MLGRTIARWLMAFVSPRPVIGFFYLPRYLSDWWSYKRRSKVELMRWRDSYPCLTDWTAQTPFDPHYFYQGAWFARKLREHNPSFHVDIGSSVLTVSTISAAVKTVFVDRRPIRARLPSLLPVGGDIVRLPFASDSLVSLSCMHVIEHIGLGRYGDPIDPHGSEKAAHELVRVLRPGGRLYVSVPVGRGRVCFNAHRVFAPHKVLEMFDGLRLAAFSYVDDQGQYRCNKALSDAASLEYGCGMFVLEKTMDHATVSPGAPERSGRP